MIEFKSNIKEFAAEVEFSTGQLRKEFQRAVDKSTLYGKSTIVIDMLKYKRTGHLAGSYETKKLAPLTNIIFSNTKYAASFESGSAAQTIHAKPGKMLVFPISQKGKTSTGILSYTAVNKYFAIVKQRQNRVAGSNYQESLTLKEVAEDLGIAFAKKVRKPRFAGRHTIGKPGGSNDKITDFLNHEILAAFKRAKL